jgi:hypothetical protein
VRYVKQVEFKWTEVRGVLARVPYEREAVNEQAKTYAAMGLSLWIENGGFVVWDDCFDTLDRTGGVTVKLYSRVLSVLGNRRTALPTISHPARSRVIWIKRWKRRRYSLVNCSWGGICRFRDDGQLGHKKLGGSSKESMSTVTPNLHW